MRDIVRAGEPRAAQQLRLCEMLTTCLQGYRVDMRQGHVEEVDAPAVADACVTL